MRTPFIQVSQLNVSYNGKPAIKNVSFRIESGNLVGIIGPNGAGKSTLMKAMLGLIPRDKGKVNFNNQPLKEVQKNIAYVPQRNNIDWDFPIIVRDTVLLGTYPKLGLFHRPKKKDKEWAAHCLERVGMEKFAKRQIGELSGGQQQRVFLARSLAQGAEYIFLDEPFVGIDVSSEQVIIDILKELKTEGKTIFVVHHDLSKVEAYFDELILINKELVGNGSVHDVFRSEKIQEAYETPLNVLGNLGVKV